MKRKKIYCVLISLMLLVCSFLSGCYDKYYKEIEATFENDGVFQYCLIDNEKGLLGEDGTYAICGKMVDVLPDVLYVPPYFNEVDVTRLGLISSKGGLSGLKYWGVEWLSTKIYLSYNFYDIEGTGIGTDKNSVVFFSAENVKVSYLVRNMFHREGVVFLEAKTFNNFREFLLQDGFFDLVEDYRAVQYVPDSDNKEIFTLIQRANITFRFNNGNAPCDVFLVDNSDGNTLITKPPYNPQIKGETFAGWYKEPECINAWDFENDLTPELEYDGDGNLIFKETKLYAKWI